MLILILFIFINILYVLNDIYISLIKEYKNKLKLIYYIIILINQNIVQISDNEMNVPLY